MKLDSAYIFAMSHSGAYNLPISLCIPIVPHSVSTVPHIDLHNLNFYY